MQYPPQQQPPAYSPSEVYMPEQPQTDAPYYQSPVQGQEITQPPMQAQEIVWRVGQRLLRHIDL